MKDNFNVTETTMQSDEIIRNISKILLEVFSNEDLSLILKVQETDIVSEKTMQEIATESFIIKKIKNKLVFADKIKEHFDINNDTSHKVAERVILREFLTGDLNISTLAYIKKSFGISDSLFGSPEIQNTIVRQIKEILLKDNYKYFLNIYIEDFGISEETVKKVAEELVIDKLSDGKIYSVLRIVKDLNISKTFLTSSAVQEFVKKIILKNFFDNNFNALNIERVKKVFEISNEDLYSSLSNDQKGRFEMIEKIAPGLTQKALSLDEIFASILQLSFEDIQSLIKSPQILKSFEENPAMATKLLLQYPQFDESPKENINFIFETKQKILEHNPNIDPNSHDFRIVMQKRLKQYRRNFDMIGQMQEEGINTSEWLNYSEETLFELGGEEASYADLIKLPSERISQTLKKHGELIQHTLLVYKKELLTKEVSLIDFSEIEQKIVQMQKLVDEANQSGNTGKAQGIQKGIEGLRKQMENGKKIPAWLKVMSDVDMIKKLFERASVINIEISQLNEENRTLAKENSQMNQKKMFENKQKIKDKSIEFVSHLKTTEIRMESLYTSIENNLSQTLGKEQSRSILNELTERLAEEREHFTSDKSTLENVIKLNESEDDVKGSLLKIKVWDRNPDIDLYMGNYSDCCVRIDSEYHGSESPISDYITDLGIQIVAAYDEKTGKPFAAAWCYIGEDKNGDKAFVVDNIEAMGPCMLYQNDIQDKMKKYIEDYAKASGLDVISQGPYNNDLVVTPNLEEKYKKLAGYNTQGYYLEAEPDDEEHHDEDEELDDAADSEEERLISEYSRTQENIVSLEEALDRASRT